MSLCLTLRPGARTVFKRLDHLAATGDYGVELLHQIGQLRAAGHCKATIYYLASLYLQSGNEEHASALLADQTTASVEMKRFFHVLSFCRQNKYVTPKLTSAEVSCIDFLDKALNPVAAPLVSVILNAGGFSVVGNAPGPRFTTHRRGARFYFNQYQCNTRISDKPAVHVATPSWGMQQNQGDCKNICITGNNIFYRRSRVWQRFAGNGRIDSVYTMPRSLWGTLYSELGTSPSAGLLILAFVAEVAGNYPQKLYGHVAGFSNGQPATNHDYDTQPASTRHNWKLETVVRNRLLGNLEHNCTSLIVEA